MPRFTLDDPAAMRGRWAAGRSSAYSATRGLTVTGPVPELRYMRLS